MNKMITNYIKKGNQIITILRSLNQIQSKFVVPNISFYTFSLSLLFFGKGKYIDPKIMLILGICFESTKIQS